MIRNVLEYKVELLTKTLKKILTMIDGGCPVALFIKRQLKKIGEI